MILGQKVEIPSLDMGKIGIKEDSNTVREVFSSLSRNVEEVCEPEDDALEKAFMLDSDEIGEIQDIGDQEIDEVNQLDCAIDDISRISDQELIADIGILVDVQKEIDTESENNPE